MTISFDQNNDDRTRIIAQSPEDSFAHNLGGLSVYGDAEQPALKHEMRGSCQVTHGSAPQRPLVHVLCWEEDRVCQAEMSGRVTLAGDPQAPFQVQMAHSFATDHRQTHVLAPTEHTHHVDTQPASPIHHALQLNTPLQVRLCNPWLIASQYLVELAIAGTSLLTIRINGETTATPQPEVPPSPPVAVEPGLSS